MQTYTRVFCAVAIALCAAPIAALAADPRPCELFSPKEIASVLGGTPKPGQLSEVMDKDVAAMAWDCEWSVGGRKFIARVIRFPSAADATRELPSMVEMLTSEVAMATMALGMFESSPVSSPDVDLKLSEVPGPGEQNFWGSSYKNDTIWISRKGQTVLGVVVIDMDKPMRPESLREPIRDLVASGLRKLP
ncbi:MAG: hypothetical protein AABY61_03660 [Nitrospirota bacterium]